MQLNSTQTADKISTSGEGEGGGWAAGRQGGGHETAQLNWPGRSAINPRRRGGEAPLCRRRCLVTVGDKQPTDTGVSSLGMRQ